MTLTQLRYVVEVADAGSITAAAARLFIAQPSLSKAVGELEAEMGVQIFERSSRGVAPTEDTVKDGSYVIQRPFVLVTKTGETLSENAQKFFDFALSAEAAQYITSAGAVPVNG